MCYAPVMLIFIAIFTCLPSCINHSNNNNVYFTSITDSYYYSHVTRDCVKLYRA